MITPTQVDSVLNYFYNNNDNRSSSIAKALNIKLHFVNYIIDLHLSKKSNYMGNPIIHGSKEHHGNCKKIIAYDANDDIIATFASIKKCSKELNVTPHTIKNNLNGVYFKTHKGYSFEYKE